MSDPEGDSGIPSDSEADIHKETARLRARLNDTIAELDRFAEALLRANFGPPSPTNRAREG